jgi:hypothetical protein
VSNRAKSLASAMDRIVEPVPPAGGGAGVAAVGEDICAVACYWSAHFDDLPSDDFLQTDM